jgi:hypothetical protein
VSLMEQELLTLPEHLSSPRLIVGFVVTRSLVLCVCFVDRCVYFCVFLLTIVLSVLLRFTDSDYPFDIFKDLLSSLCLSFMCMFCRSLCVLLCVSFDHCVVCSSSIYGFWLPLWYLQRPLIFAVPHNSAMSLLLKY